MVYSPKLLCYSIFSYRPFPYKLTFQQHCSFCDQYKTDVHQTFVQAAARHVFSKDHANRTYFLFIGTLCLEDLIFYIKPQLKFICQVCTLLLQALESLQVCSIYPFTSRETLYAHVMSIPKYGAGKITLPQKALGS